MMTSKIAHQLASLLKQRLSTFNRKKRRMVVSEEEMDNIANEALEAVLGCTWRRGSKIRDDGKRTASQFWETSRRAGFFNKKSWWGRARKPNTLMANIFWLKESVTNGFIKKYTFQTICASSLWVCNNLTYFTVVEFKIRVLVVHVGFQWEEAGKRLWILQRAGVVKSGSRAIAAMLRFHFIIEREMINVQQELSKPLWNLICTWLYIDLLPARPTWSPVPQCQTVKGIRIVLRLALSLLINPALNWIQSSPSVQFQLCATLIEMVAGDGQQMQLLQTLRNRNGVSCASVLSRDWNMDFHCHLSSNSRGVNRSRSSVLRVHFLFACHTAPTRRARRRGGTMGVEANCRLRLSTEKLSDYYQKWDKHNTTPANTHVAP